MEWHGAPIGRVISPVTQLQGHLCGLFHPIDMWFFGPTLYPRCWFLKDFYCRNFGLKPETLGKNSIQFFSWAEFLVSIGVCNLWIPLNRSLKAPKWVTRKNLESVFFVGDWSSIVIDTNLGRVAVTCVQIQGIQVAGVYVDVEGKKSSPMELGKNAPDTHRIRGV